MVNCSVSEQPIEQNQQAANGLNRIFIAPPFGQFFDRTDVSPVLGSYTLLKRPGRYLQALKTVRPLGKGNWVNRIGLRNPGIETLTSPPHARCVLSIAAVAESDWPVFLAKLGQNIQARQYAAVELNLSCPNVTGVVFDYGLLAEFGQIAPQVIVKLPPMMSTLEQIKLCLQHGVNTFHLSNTYPTKRGGMSGQLLRKINLRLLKRVRKVFGSEVNIIAGGGVYSIDDAREYLAIGVEAISLGTLCYYPWRLAQVIAELKQVLPATPIVSAE